ncbi:penicillin amidase [Aeromicrobium sp. Root495]|uniref:penicillin acylase family protein n=1 Tax=Aeromicrobium sp. Root495 TaxID=1736550 RepID=UPI0006FA2379|nr:penicillin acylase family protein [Aeromicrobium sp. Root495]KQY60286.1 penicillin amidase [Aeromicrobium sp. Root495]
MRRFLQIVVGVVTAAAVALAVVSFITVRRSFPDTSGTVRLDGVDGTVRIVRDAKGIPQVYADDPDDLFFAQGYVQAQDRFYEMDFRRHVTSGRLAELVGDGALETDEFVRTLGWRRVAEQEYRELDDGTKTLLRSYARGVNAYIEGKSGSQLSLEYTVLSLTGPDYRPEPWTPADSVAWIKAMAWDLRSNMSDEIERTLLASSDLTREQVEQLYPEYPRQNATIVGDAGTVEDGAFEAEPADDASAESAPDLGRSAVASLTRASRAARRLPALLGTGDGIGSNSWVVDGSRSSTGKPILANDPHLAPSMPGIWYQVGLHCNQVTAACPYDVAGFSFAGMPGVVVGHNRSIAWGVTTMYADVADLYLEKVAGDTYEYRGRRLPVVTRQETFKVAGGKSKTITVRSTRHGPILSDLDDDIEDVGRAGGGDHEVALRWTALTPRPTIKAVFALGRAQDWDEFREAAKLFTVPSQNLVYADRKGHIGYQSPGAIPIRSRGDGRWPVPGWDGRHEWTGYVPFDELPSVLDPSDGFIVTANNKVIGDQYPYVLGADTAPGYRSQRIRDLLTGHEGKLSVADMTRLQLDESNPLAPQLVPLLQAISLDDAFDRQGQDVLRGWDFQQDADSAAAAYFNVVWRHLLKGTFADQLPEGHRPNGGERWFQVVSTILKDPGSPWWDDVRTPGVVERRDDVLAQAMREARNELTAKQARDPDDWSWGRLHRLELVNPTLGESGIGLVESIFNRGPYEVGGGSGLVNATGWDAREGYEVTAVPSMRMVVDLDDLDRSRWIQLTGNSGHAYHANYLDQAPLWAEGKTLPWAFGERAVERSAENTLTLEPTRG